MKRAGCALALALLASTATAADEPPPDQSGYSVLRPAPDDKLRDRCFDRPAKGTSACTVDAGRWQLETELFDGAFQRQHGVTTDDWRAVNPTLKLGVSARADVEIALPLFQSERTHDASSGATDTLSGVGDLTLAVKYALVGNSGSDLAVVVRPFLTVPTARSSLGAGDVQGGVLLPLSASLPAGWSLNVTPEVDVLPNQAGGGRHAQAVTSVGLSHSLGAGFNGTVEAWAQRDFDPGSETTQASFDLGLAWTPGPLPDLQFDAGLNLGLTRNTPGAEVYAGVSKRF